MEIENCPPGNRLSSGRGQSQNKWQVYRDKGGSLEMGGLTNQLECRPELQADRTELRQVNRKPLAGGRRDQGCRVWDMRNIFKKN